MIKILASNFASSTNVNTASLASMKTTIDDLIKNINDVDKTLKSIFDFISSGNDVIDVSFKGFYGFMIFFSVFALIGTILTVCCNKYGCRHLMYFSCIFIFLATLVTFLLAFIFSVLFPVFTWTCSYLNYSL